MWDLFVILLSLGLLMYTAYKGFSVILMAPLCALLAVFLIAPNHVLPFYSGVFMPKMVNFIKDYFLVFLLGAIFGKVVEMSGIASSIAKTIVSLIGAKRAILTVVLLGAILTYSGVSLFVVVFAVYPFAAEMFKQSQIPKRLMPATIALGAFTFTMDAMPGSPQIQNIIPTTFFNTTSWAAPTLGIIGSLFIVITGIIYLESRRKKAQLAGEGYGDNPRNEPQTPADIKLVHPLIALSPLLLVGLVNLLLTHYIPHWYPSLFELQLAGMKDVVPVEIKKITAIWAVLGALCSGILCILIFSFKTIFIEFADGTKSAISGAILAAMNTGSEYGFGAIIAALPGFVIVAGSLQGISNPLLNEAITINILAGITGSSSGGMSIALGAMADQFVAAANSAGIPLEVLHRVASMAAGGMDTLPHNGAIITLLTVTGLTHREAYKDIFSITIIKIAASFLIIGVFYMTGWS